MLRKIRWRILVIILSAGAIAYSTYSYLKSLQPKVKVVVAAEEIPANSEIEASMLKTVEVEVNSAQTLLSKPATDPEELIGGFTLEKIAEGKPIELDPKLIIFPEKKQLYLRANGQLDVTYFIPKDMRLITLALEPDAAVSNITQKGDWVDVIFTSQSDGTELSYSNIILQQAEIFDVEKLNFEDQETGKQGMIQHVTLLVSPQDAAILSLAKRQGKIDLALNPWNGEEMGSQPVSEMIFSEQNK